MTAERKSQKSLCERKSELSEVASKSKIFLLQVGVISGLTHNWSLQPISRDYDYTTYFVVCVSFIHE